MALFKGESKVSLQSKFLGAFSLVVILLSFGPIPGFGDEAIKMAIFPRKPVLVTAKQYQPIADFLSDKIKKKVELVVFKDFSTFWKGLQKEEYHLVHFNQYHYIKSHKELGYTVIFKNEEFGSSEINAAIVVRRDSNIHTVSDLTGKKVVFGGGEKAMQSYIGAKHILRTNGLEDGAYTQDFAVNPPNAILAVFNRLADAGGIGEVVLSLPMMKKKIDTHEIRVLARGRDLPMLPWAVRDGMDENMVREIKNTMINLKNSKEGMNLLKGAAVTSYVQATDEEYDIVRKIVKEAINEEY